MDQKGLIFRVIRCVLVLSLGVTGLQASGGNDRVNLALNKPASASSIENDEHGASKANDGDAQTFWCADDEPEGTAEWWQVDLEKPVSVASCEIRWPYAAKRYRYKVEGSTDRKSWLMLSDQTATDSKLQTHHLQLEKAGPVRFVKVTVTAVDEGCWPSISDVKLFGVP